MENNEGGADKERKELVYELLQRARPNSGRVEAARELYNSLEKEKEAVKRRADGRIASISYVLKKDTSSAASLAGRVLTDSRASNVTGASRVVKNDTGSDVRNAGGSTVRNASTPFRKVTKSKSLSGSALSQKASKKR